MKAVILARVSSKEQEEGHSLKAQVGRLTEFAKRKGLDVIRVFEIIESSTHGNRKQFKEALKFCEKQGEKIAIVADAVDRIQRSFNDSILLNNLMQKGIIELHFWRENMVLGEGASSTDIMRWDFAVMAAKSYILQLSENVRRSINYKIQHGELSGPAPLGYKNIRDEHNKSQIIIDETTGPKVKKLFEMYALGGCSFAELAKYANNELHLTTKTGKQIRCNIMHRMVCNPFYYGEMTFKGRLLPHKYARLVSKELWDRCQEVRTGAHRKPYKYSEKDFLFRGLIRSAYNGKICPTDQKKGKYNYIVYTDIDGKRKYVSEEIIIDKVADILDSIVIPDDIVADMEKHLKELKAQEQEFRDRELANLQKELTTTRTRIDRLFELFLDKKVDDEMYQNKISELKIQADRINTRIRGHELADENFNETLISLFKVANKSGKYFRQSSQNARKRIILKTVIRTLEIQDGKLGYSLHFPFSEMQKTAPCPKWRPIWDSVRTPDQQEYIRRALANLNEAIFGTAA